MPDELVRELHIAPPIKGIQEGLDEALPDGLYSPLFSPDLENVRVSQGKFATRPGMELWEAIGGSGDVRLLAHHYEADGTRIRLAAQGSGASATLYDFVEGTDSSFNATSGGTSLGGTTHPYFRGVSLNDAFYFTDRAGALRKYVESASTQVTAVSQPTAPGAAPTVQTVWAAKLENWEDPTDWTESDGTNYTIDDDTADNPPPLGGNSVLITITQGGGPGDTITENVSGEDLPSHTIAFLTKKSRPDAHQSFQIGINAADDYSLPIRTPKRNEWFPKYFQIGDVGEINFKRFISTDDDATFNEWFSSLYLPGRLEGAYRWVYTHLDPATGEESEPSPISNNEEPLDVSAVGVDDKMETVRAFQKAVAMTFVSDSGSDASTTKFRIYRNGGVPELTKGEDGRDVWYRVGEVFDQSTTFSSSPSAGATSFTVTSATNLAAGTYLILDKGTVGAQEFAEIVSVVGTTVTVKEPLTYAHTATTSTVQVAFLDNVANEMVDVNAPIQLERDDPPSASLYIAKAPNGRLWLFNYSGKPTGVAVSNAPTPDRPTDYEVFPDGVDPMTRRDPLQGWRFEITGDVSDEEIVWGGFFNDYPTILTRTHLYQITAQSQAQWGPQSILSVLSVGCIAGDTVCEVNGVLYWVADGPRVMRWSGQGPPEVVSHLRVNERLRDAPTDQWNEWFAVAHTKEEGRYYSLYFRPAIAGGAGDESGAIDPLTLSGLELYLRADQVEGDDSDPVSDWPDLSPNGWDVTQATSTQQPSVLATGAPNGGRLIRFAGGSSPNGDTMARGGLSSQLPANTNGYTFYVVGDLKTRLSASTANYVFSSDGGGAPMLIHASDDEGLGLDEDAIGFRDGGGFDVGGDSAFGFQVMTWVFNLPNDGSGVANIYQDGTLGYTTTWNFSSSTDSGFNIAGNQTQQSCAQMDLGALLWFSEAHDDETREGVEAYLSAYFEDVAAERLDYNVDADVWESTVVRDGDDVPLVWAAAAVRHAGTDVNELFQADSEGNIYEMETGSTDNAVAITIRARTKKIPLGAVCMLHALYLRLEAVTDSATISVSTGGSEFGDVTKEYSVSFSGDGEKEIEIELERDLLGRWAQVMIEGEMSNRPAIREMVLWVIPDYYGRISA